MGNRGKRAPVRRHRTTTKIMDGVVQPKNRHAPTVAHPGHLVVRRDRPGRGWRHVLEADDVRRFLELIEDWDTLGRGLHTVLLAEGSYGFGYWTPGVVAVRALPDDRCLPGCTLDAWALDLFDVLDVRSAPGACPVCAKLVDVFALSKEQARAWQLLDVLLHELGHHHDALTNRGSRAARGEGYALGFAEERWRRMWPRYQRVFRI